MRARPPGGAPCPHERSEVPETIDFQNASSESSTLADQNRCLAATVVSHSLRGNIHLLFDSTSRDPYPRETTAKLLHLSQFHCVGKDSIPGSLARETIVCLFVVEEVALPLCWRVSDKKPFICYFIPDPWVMGPSKQMPGMFSARTAVTDGGCPRPSEVRAHSMQQCPGPA